MVAGVAIEIHTATQDGAQVVVMALGDAVAILAKQDAIDIGAALTTAAFSFPAIEPAATDKEPTT